MSNLCQCKLCGERGQFVGTHAIPRSILKRTNCDGENIAFEHGKLDENRQSDGNAPKATSIFDLFCKNEASASARSGFGLG